MSNFLRRTDSSQVPPHCRPARADEIHPALRLVLGSGGTPADHEQVVEFISLAHQRGINLSDIWVAERNGQIASALLPIVSPGRTMLVLMPIARGRDIAPGALLEEVCQRFGQRGVYLAQALLDPAEPAQEKLFAVHGFRRMAELLYLHGGVRNAEFPELPEGMSWQTYSPQTHSLFAQAIISTYQNSLDCPGLNGLRNIEDVLAGHKASGEFDPRHWYLLTENGEGRGVLLLSRLVNSDSAELVYVGLATEARSRGLSDLLMRQAIAATAQMGRPRLALAVDSKNIPALRLYYRFGFAKAGSKVAMMRVIGK